MCIARFFFYSDVSGLRINPTTSVLASLPCFTIPSNLAKPASICNVPADSYIPLSTSTVVQSLPLPPKLVKNIQDFEYVEMAELVPDNWQPKKGDQGCCHTCHSQHKGPVNDILLWVECYALMVAMLADKYPQIMSQFMQYQITIVRARKSYGGSDWLMYIYIYTSFSSKVVSVKSLG